MISMDNQTRQFKLWTKQKGNDTPWTRTEQMGCYVLEEKVTDKYNPSEEQPTKEMIPLWSLPNFFYYV